MWISKGDIKFSVQIIFVSLMIGCALASCTIPIYAVSILLGR